MSENGVKNFKMVERTSMFTVALFGIVLQKTCGLSTIEGIDLENRPY